MNIKALYWIALGAFVLALNSEYRNGGLPLAHRAAGRAQAVYCQVAARAEQSLAVARLLVSEPVNDVSTDEVMTRAQAEVDRELARRQAQLDRALAMRQAELNRALAMRQADLDRMQQKVERVQVVMDRVQMDKLQKLDRMRFKFSDATNRRTFVVCPETGAKIVVNVPDVPEVADIQ